MTDRLADARRRGKFEIEDFVGMFVLDRFESMPFTCETAWGPRLKLGARIVLDGIGYAFVAIDDSRALPARLRIHMDHVDYLPLRGHSDYVCHEGPFVVELRNRWDVAERTDGKTFYGSTLDAKMIYATCDAFEGRVLFELGEEIMVNPWGVQFISTWYPKGASPSYLEGRDPDEPPPVEIVNPVKPYLPKRAAGSSRRKRQVHG